jgi:hypothetical protein
MLQMNRRVLKKIKTFDRTIIKKQRICLFFMQYKELIDYPFSSQIAVSECLFKNKQLRECIFPWPNRIRYLQMLYQITLIWKKFLGLADRSTTT